MEWIILLIFAVFTVSAERKRFDDCEVWQLSPTESVQLNQLRILSDLHDDENDDKIMFWEEPGKLSKKVEILACKEGIQELKGFMELSGIPGKVISTDLQRNLDDLWARSDARHAVIPHDYVEDEYNTFEDILNQLDVLQGNCPAGVNCVVENIGSSVEGRPIVIFRMTKEGENRRGVFLDSLTHAREWLSGATLMGILSRMINEYGTNPEATRLVDNYNWHIVPVVNPDGYVYTWTDNRMWRKSRSVNDGSTCMGVDLNRNFDYEWGGPGSSDNPCSDGFRGETAGSEPETQAIQSAGEALRGELVLWITYHCYAEIYLFVFGIVDDGECRRAPNHDDIDRAGQAAVTAIQETYNQGNWIAGSTCEALYAVSGSTQDWAYGAGLVRYSYTPELRGPGFNPDPSNIIPSTEENWNGLVAMVNEIEEIEGF